MNVRGITARAQVILRAAPTWIGGAAIVVTVAADEVAKVLPTHAAETVGSVAVQVLAWLGAAVAIIRRVTPVRPEERGILPTSTATAPATLTPDRDPL